MTANQGLGCHCDWTEGTGKGQSPEVSRGQTTEALVASLRVRATQETVTQLGRRAHTGGLRKAGSKSRDHKCSTKRRN